MRIFSILLLALLGFAAHADVWHARYGVAETFNFRLYNADGTLDVDEVDGGTEVSLSCNEGAETTATNDFVDEGTFYSIALTATEMQCERIAVVIAATTTEVFFVQTHSNASAMTPTSWVDVREWHGSDLLTGTGPLAGLGVIDRGTALADSTTTLQLRPAAAFADDELIGATGLIYSATTGAGQRGTFSDYVGSTDTATFSNALVTDPTGAVRYEVYGTAAISGSGGGLDAAGVRSALGLSTANLDIQLLAIDNFVDDLESRVGTPSNLGSGATLAANVADIEGQTDDIGAAGAGLTAADDAVITAIGALNDLSTAEIRDLIIEDQGGGVSLGCAIAVVLAYAAGDLTSSGGNSTHEDPSGIEPRVIATTTSIGNRTVTITCPTY